MNKVGVIVSDFKAAGWANRRFDSIERSTIPVDVVVVVEMGSTERDELDQWLDAHPNPKQNWQILSTPNLIGLYEAWNIAISVIDTPYITNANMDDYVYADTYSNFANVLDSCPDISCVYGNEHVATKREIDAQYIGYDKRMKHQLIRNGMDAFGMWYTGCHMGSMPMWRRSVHNEIGLFDTSYRCAGDYEFWLRMAYHGYKFLGLDTAPGLFTMDDASLGNKDLISSWEMSKARTKWDRDKIFINPFVKTSPAE